MSIAALYFGVGLILALFGPAKLNIAREVQKVKDLKPSLQSVSKPITKNKIMLFRLILTVGFIAMWPFFLSGVLRANQRSADIALFNNLKRSVKNKKFKCPKCNKKEAVKILYGYPSPETLQAWHRKEIELGGCIVDREMLNRKCMKCNYEWKTNDND